MGFYTQPASQPSYIPTRPDLKCNLPPRARDASARERASVEGEVRPASVSRKRAGGRRAVSARRLEAPSATNRGGMQANQRCGGALRAPSTTRKQASGGAEAGQAKCADRAGGGIGSAWRVWRAPAMAGLEHLLDFLPPVLFSKHGSKAKKVQSLCPNPESECTDSKFFSTGTKFVFAGFHFSLQIELV